MPSWEDRFRALSRGQLEAYRELSREAEQHGANKRPTRYKANGEEIGEGWLIGRRLVLRMDPRTLARTTYPGPNLGVLIGLPKDEAYPPIERLSQNTIIACRPKFETQRSWFYVWDWNEQVSAAMRDLVRRACERATS